MSSGSDTSRGPSDIGDGGPHLAFDALADPVRREMLAVLAEEEELSAGALAERITSVGRTAVSMHLRVLRHAGLVSERRAGKYRYYAINPAGSAREVMTLLQGLFQSTLREVQSAVEDEAPDVDLAAETG